MGDQQPSSLKGKGSTTIPQGSREIGLSFPKRIPPKGDDIVCST